jgi:GT2 family glycosyltransferase
MSADRLAVSVVAPTYQRVDRLRRLVAALEAQDLPPDRFEVLVVDDASQDATPEVLAQLVDASPLPHVRVLRLERNGGPAAARNAGWRAARAEVVAFVDDDCTPTPGWAAAHVRAFDRNERLGVVQGWTQAADGARTPWSVAREVGYETPWFEGCNIAYRKAALEATGGFDEELRWYGEDTAAGWKVVEAGWERDFATGAVVVHDLEDRGLRWRIRHGWLETNLVRLAARHPGLRASGLWRRWAFRPQSVTLPLAVIAVVAAVVWTPWAALAVLPYLLGRPELLRRPRGLAGLALVDAAASAGHLHGSIRGRALVL